MNCWLFPYFLFFFNWFISVYLFLLNLVSFFVLSLFSLSLNDHHSFMCQFFLCFLSVPQPPALFPSFPFFTIIILLAYLCVFDWLFYLLVGFIHSFFLLFFLSFFLSFPMNLLPFFSTRLPSVLHRHFIYSFLPSFLPSFLDQRKFMYFFSFFLFFLSF